MKKKTNPRKTGRRVPSNRVIDGYDRVGRPQSNTEQNAVLLCEADSCLDDRPPSADSRLCYAYTTDQTAGESSFHDTGGLAAIGAIGARLRPPVTHCPPHTTDILAAANLQGDNTSPCH